MKLQKIVDMMDIKEHEQVWFISFLIKKAGSGAIATSKVGHDVYIS